MSMYRTQKMKPRNGHTLVVLTVARISGCASQKDVSLEDQQEHAEEMVEEVYEGDSVEYRVISTRGKGELLTRPELRDIERQLRTREIDLFVKEDLGRLVRGIEASRLYGIAVDHGTRAIAIHDCIDTWEDGWEEDVIAASRDHVSHNIQTSKRLKKKLMLRFKRKGAATPCNIAGYVKPVGAKTFHDWYVDESCRPIILDAAKLLREHLNCSALADYFNSVKFPVGPYCRNDSWDGAMVRRFYSNAILKGWPERGNKHSVKHHETGKRRSVKNPEGPVNIEMSHLQILPAEEFDELNALLKAKNSSMGRKPYAKGLDPLQGVPRKRTRFPGQHARCWYCGRIYVWGGNGIKDNLQCTGSRQYKCWNSIGISGARIAGLAVEAIWDKLNAIGSFENDLFQLAAGIANEPLPDVQSRLTRLKTKEAELLQQESNLLEIMKIHGHSEIVEKGLKSLKEEKRKLCIEGADLRRRSISSGDLPGSVADLKEMVKTTFLDIAHDSYEFGHLLPKIVPEIQIHCVRLCNGGALLPRAKMKIDLSGSFEDNLPKEFSEQLITYQTVDLFDIPRIESIREEVVELHNRGTSKKAIENTISGRPSLPSINKALDLQEAMDQQRLNDPFVLQIAPPCDLAKLKRHHHARYEFSMLDGYDRPDI